MATEHSPDYLKGRAEGRAEALEEAAECAERHGKPHAAENTKRRMGNPVRVTARPMALLSIRIAAAIRALKETPR